MEKTKKSWLILALLLGGFVLLTKKKNNDVLVDDSNNNNTGGGAGNSNGSNAGGGGSIFVSTRKETGIYFTAFDTTSLSATAELVWKENSTNTITARKVTVKTVGLGQKDYLNERVGDLVFYGIANQGSLLFGIVAYGKDYLAQVDFIDFDGATKGVLSVPSVAKGLVKIDSSQINNVYDEGLLGTQGIIFI